MIVDADAHVAECPEIFDTYLDPAYADRRPKLIPVRRERGWWDFDGLILPRQSGPGRGPELGYAAGAECNDIPPSPQRPSPAHMPSRRRCSA